MKVYIVIIYLFIKLDSKNAGVMFYFDPGNG